MPRERGKARARRWYAAAGLGVAAGVAVFVLPQHQPRPSRSVADSCGLVHCQAILPTPGSRATPSAAARSHHARRSHASPAPARRHRRQPTPSPAASSPAPRPSASPTPPPSPSPSPSPSPTRPDVTVSYTLEQGHDGHGKQFQGLLTLTNLGGAAVPGWTLQLSFSGDAIGWVGPPGSYTPFDSWTYTGATLALTAATSEETLAPGGSEQIMIWGQGSADTPASCTFDGAACTP